MNTSYLTKLIKEFGVTDDPGTGGFILPEGNFLDLSGGGGFRCMDHRSILSAYPRNVNYNVTYPSRTEAMENIMKVAGLIRWMPERWYAELVTRPTAGQIATLLELGSHRPLSVEVKRGYNKKEYDYSPETIDLLLEDLPR
jgi:hypothetical protein